MAYTVLPISGADLVNLTTTNTNSAGTAIPTFGPLGAEVFGSDGKRYVFAQAGAGIAASTATCSINTTSFAATGTGGSYMSPGVSLASGDFAWFGAASV